MRDIKQDCVDAGDSSDYAEGFVAGKAMAYREFAEAVQVMTEGLRSIKDTENEPGDCPSDAHIKAINLATAALAKANEIFGGKDE